MDFAFKNWRAQLVFSLIVALFFTSILGESAQAETYYVPPLKREAASIPLDLPVEKSEFTPDVLCRVVVKAGRGYDADRNSIKFSSHRRIVRVPRSECSSAKYSALIQDDLSGQIAEDYGLEVPVFEYELGSVRPQ